jgi:ankyrin repeat protein
VQGIKNDKSKGAEIARSLVEALLEDRSNRTADRLRRTFRKSFIDSKMNATVQWFAVWYGLVTVLNLVWEEGISRDSKGWTPLHVAAYEGHGKVVDFILKKSKRHVSLTNKEGRSALHIAAMMGCKDVVNRLLQGGIDVQAKDLVGFTALDLAIEEGNWEIVSCYARIVSIPDGTTAVIAGYIINYLLVIVNMFVYFHSINTLGIPPLRRLLLLVSTCHAVLEVAVCH